MKAYLSIGSNLGNRGDYLQAAVEKLDSHNGIEIYKVSSIYETEPWGLTEQPAFWNQALEIETQLEPLELLKICQDVENTLGRERTLRWGPRTIDIDILLYGDMLCELPELTLPHPHMEARAFVMEPLKEIAPDLRLPSGRSVLDVQGEGTVKIVHS